ncbi:hypothetical protein PHMEG_00029381 [Phytophthora megakarya]|uniref:Uncharacterized protein n=1 Tax=Phytophthora megakarya TaxID=4795 RepID=A0A225V2R1_9STRA|nr:hypothetical protein PHMEG_00029381 [Phytophthora megakarya]
MQGVLDTEAHSEATPIDEVLLRSMQQDGESLHYPSNAMTLQVGKLYEILDPRCAWDVQSREAGGERGRPNE